MVIEGGGLYDIPPGYTVFGKDIQPHSVSSNRGSIVCKLLKSLYGLKQAPKQWFEKLSTALIQFEFHQSKADYTLFTKHTNKAYTAVLVYVDDMIVTGSDDVVITELKSYLSPKFHMKHLDQ